MSTKKDMPENKSTIVEVGEELLPQWRQAIALQQDAGQTEVAISAYLNIIQKCPTALSAHDNLAILYMRRKEYDQALAHLEKALHPLYFNAYVTIGVLYYATRSLDKAIDAYKKAGKEKSAFSNLCSAYYAQGDFDAAINAGEKAIEQDPTDLEAYGNLVRVYTEVGKQDKAKALLANASKSLDINLIRPGVSRNWYIHLVIYDPETHSMIQIDPRTNEMFSIKENAEQLENLFGSSQTPESAPQKPLDLFGNTTWCVFHTSPMSPDHNILDLIVTEVPSDESVTMELYSSVVAIEQGSYSARNLILGISVLPEDVKSCFQRGEGKRMTWIELKKREHAVKELKESAEKLKATGEELKIKGEELRESGVKKMKDGTKTRLIILGIVCFVIAACCLCLILFYMGNGIVGR